MVIPDLRLKGRYQELRPVTYHFDIDKENEIIGAKPTPNWDGKYDIEKIQFSGFLAQEVDAAAKKIGYNFSGVDKSGPLMGLRYAEFVVPLVKAVQELNAEKEAQRKLIEAQQKTNDSQQKLLEEMQKQILQLQNTVEGLKKK